MRIRSGVKIDGGRAICSKCGSFLCTINENLSPMDGLYVVEIEINCPRKNCNSIASFSLVGGSESDAHRMMILKIIEITKLARREK